MTGVSKALVDWLSAEPVIRPIIAGLGVVLCGLLLGSTVIYGHGIVLALAGLSAALAVLSRSDYRGMVP